MNEINQSFWFFMTDGLKTKSTDDNVIYILHRKHLTQLTTMTLKSISMKQYKLSFLGKKIAVLYILLN